MDRRRVAIAFVVVALLGVAGALAYLSISPGACRPLGGSGILKSVVDVNSFGGVSEYELPTPPRWSNAIAVAPDGSVWFGEQSVPGLGHLYPWNRTLVEYPWPSKPQASCGYQTGIWGVALWNGMVWGTDNDRSALVGLDPRTGSTRVLNVSGVAPFPYALAVSPDGSLWFTSLSSPARLGRIGTDLSMRAIGVAGLGKQEPIQIQFVNSTLAYMVALNPSVTTNGGLYSFDPRSVNGSLTATKVGGNFTLFDPDGLSVYGGVAWIAQHGPSSVVSYNFSSRSWTTWPTSTLGYTQTTLPYFVDSSARGVWFNEHYGNRIAFIDPTKGLLTEYSEANPPITNGSEVHNDLTIASAANGLWFTSTTGNYIGFVNGEAVPAFSVGAVGGNSGKVQAGGQTVFHVRVEGAWSGDLKLQVSDSELLNSVPRLITIGTGQSTLPPASGGAVDLTVTVAVSASLRPGEYTLAVTATDGLVYQTAYIFLTVT